jgi:transposase-like protein
LRSASIPVTGRLGQYSGAVSYLSSTSRDALDRVIEGDNAKTGPDALSRLRDIRSLLAELEKDPATLTAVREALDSGSSWESIADAAGLKPSAAKWRWLGSDQEIAERHEAGRKRAVRPSSVPTDLPGLSVSEAATRLGVTAQAIYLRVSRGSLRAETVELGDGRKYKRVFLDDSAEPADD